MDKYDRYLKARDKFDKKWTNESLWNLDHEILHYITLRLEAFIAKADMLGIEKVYYITEEGKEVVFERDYMKVLREEILPAFKAGLENYFTNTVYEHLEKVEEAFKKLSSVMPYLWL